MNTSPRLLLTLAGALLALHVPIFAAAPKVEATVIGPTNEGGAYTVAFSGAHVAYSGMKGTRFYVNVDGVAGPEFDALYKTNGPEYFFPVKAGVWRSPEPGKDGNDAPVIFSRDGSHYAYSGRQGEDYVVMYDGKEIGRFPANTRTQIGPKLSPGGKHVYWAEGKLDPSQGRSIGRTVIDGKATDWGMVVVPVFSPDDEHYAWAVQASTDRLAKMVVYLDGKNTGYSGQDPVFSADGSVLYATSYEAGKTGVLANGKLAYTGPASTKIVPAPVGKRWAAIVGNPTTDYKHGPLLVVDGKVVPDSNHVEEVWFSPDGKRYAARCHDPFQNVWSMIVDGDRFEFARVDAAPPTWTADGSKVIFTVGTAEGSFVAVNDDMYPYSNNLIMPVVAERGDKFAWGTLGRGAEGHSVIVGTKSVLTPGYYINMPFMFSPDGSRYGFLVSKYNRSDLAGLVIDGALQPGIMPGYIARWITSSLSANIPFVFSPDNQHVAFVGRVGSAPKNSLYVNQTPVQTNIDNAVFVTFTPDSQHLFWMNMDPRWMTDVYVDGQMAVRANGAFFREMPTSFEVDAQGVATFLAQDGDVVKRYRITSAADVTVATLLEKGPPAVAAAPTTPPPAAANMPKPPAPVATTTPPAATNTAVPPPAATGPAVALTWNDLVRRPETRPTSCTINKDFNFQGGVRIRAGATVNILEFEPANLVVSTPDGRTNFNAKPEETDVLAVASAAWSQLTPAQRALTYPALLQRMDLWPYKLKLQLPYTLDNVKTRVGDTALLLGLENGQLLVRHESSGLAFNVTPQETDLMAQARALVASETGAPGRLLEEFSGKLVNPITGQPVALDANARPKYVVMYMGASWCGPCQMFSPKLVKLLKEKAPKPADVALLYISGDHNSTEAKGYVTKLGIDWPTIYFKNRSQMPAFQSLFGDSIPQLVVTDRHGKIVVDSAKVGTDAALAQLQKLL